MAQVSPAEVRRARAFLQSRGIRARVPPRKFAAAAKELDMGFRELLAYIGRLYSGGQGQQMRISELVRKAAESGS